ncbi:O-antigen ligase family protein [Ornithinibacillus gellani]|uniref:O-antigen ligase family protein n=1 Tax=Ornithinibacillus gellani TaxID=2293253 RepID=UPI000F4701C6|nr:O-antigen ligase family protein [Ornithinibacillus gellani]TQS71165.1 O-antigen ligase family protein [Ornithinibacillus gellani]
MKDSIKLNSYLVFLIMIIILATWKISVMDVFLQEYIPFSISNIIFVILLFSLYLILLLFLNRGIGLKNMFSINVFVITLFMVYIYISYSYLSFDYIYANDKIKHVLLIFLFTLVPLMVNFNNKYLYRFFYIIFLFNSVYIILFLIMYQDIILSSAFTGERLGTEEINSIWLARVLGENILITFVILKKKVMKIALILFQLFLIILTGSKGPLLGLFIIFVLYNISNLKFKMKFSYKKIFTTFIKISFYFIVFAVFMFLVFKFIGLEYIYSRLSSEDTYAQNSRIYRYLFSFDLIQNNLLFGIGFGNWGYYFTGGVFGRNYPHNIIIETIVELGIIGAIPLFYLLYQGMKRFLSYMKNLFNSNVINLIPLLFIYFLFNSLLSGDLGLSNVEMFIFLGMLLGVDSSIHSRSTKCKAL